MKLLESDWLFNIVERRSNLPAVRLVALFDTIDSWLAAPGIREKLIADDSFISSQSEIPSRLKHWFSDTSLAAKAENPSMLAFQLIILLQGALAEEMRNPDSRAIMNARLAAQAVITKSCQQHKLVSVPFVAAACSVVVIGLMSWFWFPKITSVNFESVPRMPVTQKIPASASFNPQQVDEVLALNEQFTRGVCAPPQMLVLPPGQVTAYMNVINFRKPENPEADRQNLRAFLTWFETTKAGDCYMPPANGHTTVSWR